MKDALSIVKEKFKEDNYVKNFNIQLDKLEENYIRMHMFLDEKLNNLFGRPHGGAIYSLADAAFSVIGNNRNNLSVALECTITYHASPDPGQILYVEGKSVHQSRRIGTYSFTLFTLKQDANTSKFKDFDSIPDENKTLIATMKSLLYRTGKPIDEQLDVL